MPVQRVRRLVRKIDPWTVLKVSVVFNAVMAVVTVLGTVVFWSVFVNAGIPERINELALTIGIENGITLDGPVYFRIVVLLAVVGMIMMTGLFTLAAVVYNLISDLVGGVELVVLEESASPRPAEGRVSLPVTTAHVDQSEPPRTLPKVPPRTPPPQPEPGTDRASAAQGTAGEGSSEVTRQMER
jgi:hypothetical protein